MIVIPGEKYGKLTVVELVTDGNANKRKWLCKCECGGEKITSEDNLKRGIVNPADACIQKSVENQSMEQSMENQKPDYIKSGAE